MKHLQFTRKMRTKILAVLLCLIAGNGLFANNVTFPVTCVTTGMLNVRQQPGKSGKVIGLLRKGKKIVVDSLHNDQWACITYKNKVAYISTSYITRKDKHSLRNLSDLHGLSASWSELPSFLRYVLIFILVCYLLMIPGEGYLFISRFPCLTI